MIMVGRRPYHLLVHEPRKAPGMPARKRTETKSEMMGSSYLQNGSVMAPAPADSTLARVAA
jgi:hypothetical protein